MSPIIIMRYLGKLCAQHYGWSFARVIMHKTISDFYAQFIWHSSHHRCPFLSPANENGWRDGKWWHYLCGCRILSSWWCGSYTLFICTHTQTHKKASRAMKSSPSARANDDAVPLYITHLWRKSPKPPTPRPPLPLY